MADIAFLLLIFFLVTTTIATDKGLTLTLPQKPDPNQKPPDVTKNQRNMFTILVNSQDRLLVEEKEVRDVKRLRKKVKEFVLNFGKPDAEYAQIYNGLPQKLKAQVRRRPDSSDDPKEAVVSFKADRGTSYKMYLAVLDELQGAYYEIYGERVGLTAEEFRNLNTKNPKEKKLYEQAKNGIPMNISIAEPTKTGGGE
jgi:biopolymer transport protein ExbD